MKRKWGPLIGGILIGLIIMAMNYKHVVTNHDVLYKNNLVYEKITDKPLTGILEEYYRNTSQLKVKVKYKNGNLNGKYYIYYKNGTLNEKGSYKNNLLHGKIKVYDKNGNLVKTTKYKNGFPID